MNQTTLIETLLTETHRFVDASAEASVDCLGNVDGTVVIAYPPNVVLSDEEIIAVKALSLSDAARSGLKKLIADAASRPLFELFALMDGVADPELADVEDWHGVDVHPRGEEYQVMLHDEFYESYWRYKERVSSLGAEAAV